MTTDEKFSTCLMALKCILTDTSPRVLKAYTTKAQRGDVINGLHEMAFEALSEVTEVVIVEADTMPIQPYGNWSEVRIRDALSAIEKRVFNNINESKGLTVEDARFIYQVACDALADTKS